MPRFILSMLLIVLTCFTVTRSSILAGPPSPTGDDELRLKVASHFTRLCDLAARVLSVPTPSAEMYTKPQSDRDYCMFFVDSYAVRALAAASDLTGKERYLEACRAWCKRILDHQRGMIPAGAYYMNYHRAPGENSGEWWVADSGSIAMGVLATALRCPEGAERDGYLASVKAYLDLVIDNFVRASGGVTDGFWKKSDAEWWCSSALFAAAAFQYFGVTGEERYLRAASRALDWLEGFEYCGTICYKFEEGAPLTVFYVMEAYFSALPYLEPGSPERTKALERISVSVEWMADNQNSSGTWDYKPDNLGVKMGGLPCLILAWECLAGEDKRADTVRIAPSGERVILRELAGRAARRALEHFALLEVGDKFNQLQAFTMISYAEYLAPGKIYNTGRRQ